MDYCESHCGSRFQLCLLQHGLALLFETSDEAAPGASVAASVANFDMSLRSRTRQPLAPDPFDWMALRKTPMFQELFRVVKNAVHSGKERQCLSHHTTAACRANRAPVESLKSCGLEEAIVSPCGTCVHVHLHLPHTFYNDDCWGIHYYSPPCPRLKDAQKIACLEILTILLAMQPNLVRIPPKCVAVDPKELRKEGRRIHQARLGQWVDPFEEVTLWEDLVDDESIHAVSDARRQHYTPGTSDDEILSVLTSWARLKSQQAVDSRRLPKHAWMYLRSVIPPHGLWDFLRRNEHAIEYWREGQSICFQFRAEFLGSAGAASGAHAAEGPLMLLDGAVDEDESLTQLADQATDGAPPAVSAELDANPAEPSSPSLGQYQEDLEVATAIRESLAEHEDNQSSQPAPAPWPPTKAPPAKAPPATVPLPQALHDETTTQEHKDSGTSTSEEDQPVWRRLIQPLASSYPASGGSRNEEQSSSSNAMPQPVDDEPFGQYYAGSSPEDENSKVEQHSATPVPASGGSRDEEQSSSSNAMPQHSTNEWGWNESTGTWWGWTLAQWREWGWSEKHVRHWQ